VKVNSRFKDMRNGDIVIVRSVKMNDVIVTYEGHRKSGRVCINRYDFHNYFIEVNNKSSD
jgi:hypothetical protein